MAAARPGSTRRPLASILRNRWAPVLVAAGLLCGSLPWTASPAEAAGGAAVLGSGSSYAALAFSQWQTAGQDDGLNIDYEPTSSPAGLTQYQEKQVSFAGTEAEFSSLGIQGSVSRGYQYTPDVAGATAVMYNADDQAGRQITYLHFSQRTVARIFMGYITNWDSPEISADNLGLVLPSHPITVVYRSGQSGTTALFYDFVKHADPTDFATWARAHDLPSTTRILSLDNTNFAPYTEPETGSDVQANAVATQPWTISYDEFAYPQVYHAQVAWIQNASGHYTQPYAVNISAALLSATLNPDLSQNLDGVYTSTNPLTYPVSAYSYIVTQCDQSAAFPTCAGSYDQTYPGGTEGQSLAVQLGQWMGYIECAGQVHMAQIGYAPLPKNLSQDMANAVGRILGKPAAQLSASNCSNPQEEGDLGVGAAGPADPYLTLKAGALGKGAGGGKTEEGATPGSSAAVAASTAAASKASGEAASVATAGKVSASSAAAAPAKGTTGLLGSATAAVGGGTGITRKADPVAFDRPTPGGVPVGPMLVLIAVLVVPGVVFGLRRRSARSAR